MRAMGLFRRDPSLRKRPGRGRPAPPRPSAQRGTAHRGGEAALYRSRPLREAPSYAVGLRATVVLLALMGVAFTLRAAQLTLLQHDQSVAQARDNVESVRRLEAPRGNIHDRRGEPVAYSRKAYSLSYSRWGQSPAQTKDLLARLGALVGEDFSGRVDEILDATPTWTRHTLARRLDEAAVVAILERPMDFPGVRVAQDFRRQYPAGPALAPVVGFVGRIPPEQADRFTRPRYLPDAFIGRAGLEARYEDLLAGVPGRERRTLDARGRLLDEPFVELAARPGHDLRLAIDAQLQAFAYGLLEGRRGSIVLMDAYTGDLLVSAGRPSFDPDAPWRQEIDGGPASFLHRPSQGLGPPGSTFKPFSALGFLAAGVSPTDTVHSRGYYMLPGWNFRWRDISGLTGDIALAESLKFSSNVYFYTLAHDLGGANIVSSAQRFGYGRPTGIDLPGERAGSIAQTDAPPPGETLNLSIGQGRFLATPLQTARAFAALANGGDLVRPRLVASITAPGGIRRTPGLEAPERIALSPAHRAAVLDGLWRVVNEPGGTAHRARFPREWDAFGKTGTAQNGRGGVDAWMAGGFPASNPRFVFVVQIEDAEAGGGEVAAPIARMLLEAYFEVEGAPSPAPPVAAGGPPPPAG